MNPPDEETSSPNSVEVQDSEGAIVAGGDVTIEGGVTFNVGNPADFNDYILRDKVQSESLESRDVKFVDSTDTYRSAMHVWSRPKLERVHEHKDIAKIRIILSERKKFEVILIKGRSQTGKSAQLQQLWDGGWGGMVGYTTADDIADAMMDEKRLGRLKNRLKARPMPLIIDDLGVGKTSRIEVLSEVTKVIIGFCNDHQIKCVIIARDISAVVEKIEEELKKTMDTGARIRLQTSLLLDKEGVADSVRNLIEEHRTRCSSDVEELMIDKVDGGTYGIGLVEEKLSNLEDGVELTQKTIERWRSETYWLNNMLNSDSDSKITNILAFHRLLAETYSRELPRIFAANLLEDSMKSEEWLDRGIKNVYFHDLTFVGSASDDWRSAGMCDISSLEKEQKYHLTRNKVNKLEKTVENKFREMQTKLTTQRMKICSGGEKVTPEEVLDALYELPDAERDDTTDRLQDNLEESGWVSVVRGLQRQLE